MFKCDTCINAYRCKLPEKYTEESEICDCYQSDEPDDADEEIIEEVLDEEIGDISVEELEEEIG